MECKVNLILFINKQKWHVIYRTKNKEVKKEVKEYQFLSFARNLSNRYKKQILVVEINTLRTVSKKIVQKAAKATGKFIGQLKQQVNCRKQNL